jgi:RNA methyltransferase, TrmH family
MSLNKKNNPRRTPENRRTFPVPSPTLAPVHNEKPKEIPVCGLAAVQALFDRDPDSIKRLFFDAANGRRVAALSSHLAKNRRVYRVVSLEELAKISGTNHHHGIVAIVDAKPLRTPDDREINSWAETGQPLILLDRIGNVHNLGAIARTAAFLGVRHMVIAKHPQQALPGEAAYRVAEGGMAHIEIWTVTELASFCRLLAKQYQVIGAATNGGKPIFLSDSKSSDSKPSDSNSSDSSNSDRSAARPIAIVMGNEEHGLSPEVAAACSQLVTIPAKADVESLNVSVAAAILLWEFWGRNR